MPFFGLLDWMLMALIVMLGIAFFLINMLRLLSDLVSFKPNVFFRPSTFYREKDGTRKFTEAPNLNYCLHYRRRYSLPWYTAILFQ